MRLLNFDIIKILTDNMIQVLDYSIYLLQSPSHESK